jgi:phosphate transport system substrate-binding protein
MTTTVRTAGPVRAILTLAAAVLAVLLGLAATGAVAGATTATTKISGQGSTYAALAFQQWIAGAQTAGGLNVNYTATGSPAGLSAYGVGTTTFAGTEAEYTELYPTSPNPDTQVPRGFAYTPDVAGAVAVMYHVHSASGTTVNYLHLSPLTIARIFMAIITTWTSPTISNDNPLPNGKNLVLPHEPITLDLRSGQSGTTALFYDWVKHTDPSQFATWAAGNGFPATYRLWEVDDGTPDGFGHAGSGHWDDLPGSDQQATAIASNTGLWSIGYDEFGYAYVYHDNVAWVENASGKWTQPYAKNISAALKSAVLAPDTSQTLVGVYNSKTPTAYPMSAYSYLLYQCATTPTRPTCKGPYSSQATVNTMAKFMRYIACTGQVKMATIGYSPLPAPLAQYMANAIGYLTGQPPPTLSASNCADPQFQGNLGVGATPPPDPITVVVTGSGKSSSATSSSSGTTSGSGSGSTGTSSGSTASSTAKKSGGASAATGGTSAASGATGTTAPGAAAAVGSTHSATQSVGGGSSTYRSSDPTVYRGPATIGAAPPWPWLVAVLFLLIPVAWLTVSTGRRRRARAASGGSTGPVGSSGPMTDPRGPLDLEE